MKKNTTRTLSILSMMITLCFITSAQVYAKEDPPKPPQKAIDACDKKADGDSCSFIGLRKDSLNGTCRNVPGEKAKLACVPKPPKEVIDACKGKAEKNACSFVTPKGETINGACRKGPLGVKEIICRPSEPSSPHPENESKPND